MHLRPQSDNNRFLTASGNVVNVWDVEAASQLQQITMQTSEHDGVPPSLVDPQQTAWQK